MVLLLKIRRAECALADDRLDEACELARDEQVRAHRRGQRLLTAVAERLVERGRRHLEADRPREALADCAKAADLAGQTPMVVELRQAASAALSGAERGRWQHGRNMAAARRHMDAGRLTIAERMIDGAGDDGSDAAALRAELEQRRDVGRRLVERAEAALGEGDVEAAAGHLLEARRCGASRAELERLAAMLGREGAARVREHLVRGRLDQARSMLGRVRPVVGENLELEEAGRMLRHCVDAARLIHGVDPSRSATALHRLRAMLGEANWVEEAARHAERAAEHLEHMRRGPLGLLGSVAGLPSHRGDPDESGSAGGEQPTQPYTPGAERPPEVVLGTGGEQAPGQNFRGHAALPPTFLMQVDGVGGFLILTRPTVTVGPISSSARPDLGLVADPALPTVRVRREDEDYFIEAEREVVVNHQPTRRALLADGARIELSPRCRLRFHRPNPASTSAVLTMGRAGLVPVEAQAAVLLDGELIIGPGRACHIAADELTEPVVLRWRDGRLVCASGQGVLVEGRPVRGDEGIRLGARVRIGPLSLVLTEARR